MANISIRNLDDSVKQALAERAKREGCSMEAMLRRCLMQAAGRSGSSDRGEYNAAGRGFSLDGGKHNAADAAHERQKTAEGADMPPQNAASQGQAPVTDNPANIASRNLPPHNFADLKGKRILLILCGSVAVYKSLELIRILRRAGAEVKIIMTKGAQQFITPLLAGAIAGGSVYTELFDRAAEQDIGHIRLARGADIIALIGATASRMAKMAAGAADDLAGAVLLAARAPVLLAPAMNPAMWAHPATRRNAARLQADGCFFIGPESGEMAESNEAGLGRMSEPPHIAAAIERILDGQALSQMARSDRQGGDHEPLSTAKQGGIIALTAETSFRLRGGGASYSLPVGAEAPSRLLAAAGSRPCLTASQFGKPMSEQSEQDKAIMKDLPLDGRHIIVTSGPTHEPIDPVRYIANRSSGQQGHSIAAALARLGARVTLISGPVNLPDPANMDVIHVTTALEMQAAVQAALPADAAIFVAAVADWRVKHQATDKIKKASGAAEPPALELVENPDILAGIGHSAERPRLVIGFAAETANLLDNAAAKLDKKGADWIVANNVAAQDGKGSIMGGAHNHIYILNRQGAEEWPEMPKTEIAVCLAARIADFFEKKKA